MQTPHGSSGLGQQSSPLPGLGWMNDSIPFSRLMSENQAAPVSISTAATPRRYSPPSPGANDLTEFFGSPQREWYGVKVERLASNVTLNEVKTMFLFSPGFDDLRIIRNEQAVHNKAPYSAEAYVRLKDTSFAEEAERLLNNKDFNGANIAVSVIQIGRAHV